MSDEDTLQRKISEIGDRLASKEMECQELRAQRSAFAFALETLRSATRKA